MKAGQQHPTLQHPLHCPLTPPKPQTGLRHLTSPHIPSQRQTFPTSCCRSEKQEGIDKNSFHPSRRATCPNVQMHLAMRHGPLRAEQWQSPRLSVSALNSEAVSPQLPVKNGAESELRLQLQLLSWGSPESISVKSMPTRCERQQRAVQQCNIGPLCEEPKTAESQNGAQCP